MVYAVSGTNKKNEGNKKKIGKCGYSAVYIVQFRVANDVAHHKKLLTQRRYM